MKAKGRHILIECYDADFEKLNSLSLIREAMLEAAVIMHATIISDSFHQFSPQGVSGAVVIAESHLTIHTWPEEKYAAIDFFTCGICDPFKGFKYLSQKLGSSTLKIQEFERGFVFPDGGGDKAKLVKEYSLSNLEEFCIIE